VLGNVGCRLSRNPYRIYIHPQSLIDSLVRAEGLEPVSVRNALFWRTAVYRRAA
jgi:hypothetical protein